MNFNHPFKRNEIIATDLYIHGNWTSRILKINTSNYAFNRKNAFKSRINYYYHHLKHTFEQLLGEETV